MKNTIELKNTDNVKCIVITLAAAGYSLYTEYYFESVGGIRQRQARIVFWKGEEEPKTGVQAEILLLKNQILKNEIDRLNNEIRDMLRPEDTTKRIALFNSILYDALYAINVHVLQAGQRANIDFIINTCQEGLRKFGKEVFE